jgi:hypothetical protein
VSIAVPDTDAERRALARAQAAAIVDAPRVPRRYRGARSTLRGSPRQRRSAQRKDVRVAPVARMPRSRRRIAAVVLLAEVVGLVLALTLPVFRVRTVTVTGNRLLTTASLLAAADVPSGSIFTVDADALRTRVLALPWVEDVAVTTDLPGAVHITVFERKPVLRVRDGVGDTVVAGNGARLRAGRVAPASLLALPVLVDERFGSAAPIDPSLLRTLVLTAARFPEVFGCSVAAFEWGTDGVLAIWSSTGWRAVLGHVDTDSAVAQVPAQLAALAALRGSLDFAEPSFGYVDLENPGAPAAGGAPGLPEQVLAARAPSAAAAAAFPGAVAPPVSTPTPTPTATLTPAPTPELTPSA